MKFNIIIWLIPIIIYLIGALLAMVLFIFGLAYDIKKSNKVKLTLKSIMSFLYYFSYIIGIGIVYTLMSWYGVYKIINK